MSRTTCSFLISMWLIAGAGPAGADGPVYFPDPRLKAAVEAELGVSEPNQADMLRLKSLYAQDEGIGDLTGIEHAFNLESLRVGGNQITDLSPLSELTKLWRLWLSGNPVSDHSPLSGLVNVRELILEFSQVGDLTFLYDLTSLKELYLWGNQVSDVSPLEGLTSLQLLDLRSNQVTDVSALRGLTGLTTLRLSGNPLGDISALQGLTNLEWLDLRWTEIASIQAVSGMTHLAFLGARENRIHDISPLSGLTNLTRLRLSTNEIDNVGALSNLTSLEQLEMHSNQIADVWPLAGLVNLVNLDLRFNEHIDDVTALADLTNLQTLRLERNRISDITALSGLINLTFLDLDINQVSDIWPLAELTNLTDIRLRKNQISDISPLSTHVGLTHLDLRVNPLNADAYHVYIPQIIANNPGIELLYDASLKARNPSPADGAKGVVIPLLYWEASPTAVSHDVYFGTHPDLGQSDYRGRQDLRLYLILEELTSGKTYYWRIDEVEPGGQIYTGDVWSFTFAFPQPSDPYPPDGGVADPNTMLTWVPGAMAAWHDVYLGTDLFAVALADTTTEGIYRGRVDANSYFPGHLEDDTYYWRVDAVDRDGTTIFPAGVWSFTVGQPLTRTLTVFSSGPGTVLTPGEGVFQLDDGTILPVEAAPSDPAHEFGMWSGTAVANGKVADPCSPETTVLVDGDYTLEAIFVDRPGGPALGFSLGLIGADDPLQFLYRVATNNMPDVTRVQPVTNVLPDPTGMMRMSLVDQQPARAKARFGRCLAERVLVRFKYLFENPGDVELVAYLSDVPELLDHDNPLRDEHYIEIGRVLMPPAGRPGAVASGRFGVFEGWVYTGQLDLSEATWVELELAGLGPPFRPVPPAHGGTRLAFADALGGDSAVVDDWAVEVHCSGICMDLNESCGADEEDFLLVIASCGESSGAPKGETGSGYCLEGLFSSDGFVDTFDLHSWVWALNSTTRLNLCRPGLPLTTGAVAMGAAAAEVEDARAPISFAAASQTLDQLLILAKTTASTYSPELLDDGFYAFDDDGTYTADYTKAGLPDRCNVRLVRGAEDAFYLVNSEEGVLDLSNPAAEVVPAGYSDSYTGEPRHGKNATVYVGIQGQGSSAFGRPILDAAFDDDNSAYVVPVVVKPDGEEAYLAAARLQLLGAGQPPYDVVMLYDDPPVQGDNRLRDNLREIEIDGSGNVYVINAGRLCESDTLWKYSPSGSLLATVELGNPAGAIYVPDPVAMHVSEYSKILYVASAQHNPADADSTVIHGMSLDKLTPTRSITVSNMRNVTAITEEPATRCLWVVGFGADEISGAPDPMDLFYEPHLAKVTKESSIATAVSISDSSSHDMALPLSIMWTGSSDCLPSCHSDYGEWVAVGKPDCWCYDRQCHGDMDGFSGGSSKTGVYYVGPADLNVVISTWLVKEAPFGPGIASVEDGICADFAHDVGGSSKTGIYRVGPSDLNILVGNWLKKEPPHGPGIDPDCLDCP